jgi:hypothetical protein
MTVPTKAEIREAIATQLDDVELDDFMGYQVIVDSDMAVIRRGQVEWSREFTPQAPHPGTLWADLRDSEIDELHEVMWEVEKRVLEEATRALIEGGIEAAWRFAQAHPDIPRGAWRPMTPKEAAIELRKLQDTRKAKKARRREAVPA